MRKLKLLIAAVALLVSAGVQAKTDITSSYLGNADLGTKNGTWSCEKYTDWQIATDQVHVNVIEFWAGSNFTDGKFSISQSITLPAGYYRIAVNAFYRNGWSGDGTNNNMAWIFAGESTKNVYALNSGDLGNFTNGGIGGSSDLQKASNAFYLGNFSNEFDFNLTEEKTINIGFQGQNFTNGSWCIFGPVKLYEYTAEDYISDYRAKVSEAENLYSSPMFGEALAALKEAVVEESSLNTVDDVQNAISNLSAAIAAANNSVTAYAAAIVPFNTLKAQADAIAAVEYNVTTSGSHETFENAIATQQSAATNAANSDAITTAISALKAAIKAYINAAEPANDGEYFDITCLMANPDFDGDITDWTYATAPGVNWSNCEYYQSEFDINQTVEGLPTGSYSLSVQAFQRPGWADAVWTAYSGGTDGASSVLYINNITSNVKNIMADAQDAAKLIEGTSYGTWPYDSRVGSEGSYKYIPNSQQGAQLYFQAGLYDATCAAVVTKDDGGSLKLGFKSTKTHVDGDWTIFDNFRLYYYGSSLLIYYKQYLPQLKDEASADLSNTLYANVLGGSEEAAFRAALAAAPESATEEDYKTVIDDIIAKQDAFRAAATSYDALVAAKAYTSLTEITANIGDGVFQYPTTTTTLWTNYSSAKNAVDTYNVSSESTAAAIQTLVDALDDAIEAYNNIELNAPATDKRYYLNIIDNGQSWDGNAITFIEGGRNDDGNFNMQYAAAANANLCQALKFTAVDGSVNTYYISALRADGGEQYLTTKKQAYGNGAHGQLRTTDDITKAAPVKIKATTTNGQFQLLNVLADDAVIARNATDPDNGVYTDGNNSFTIAEASQASVAINTSAAKWGTTILPFAVASLPDGVKAYTCAALDADDNTKLTLVGVEALEANKPYIIEGEWNTGDAPLTGWGLGAATTYTDGWLTGVYESTLAPVGSYVMQKNDEGVGFYQVEDGAQPTVGANHCYLTVADAARAAFFLLGEEATAIETIEVLTSGEAEVYTVGGARVPGLQKGMNIVRKADGKSYKVMVK